MRGASYDAIVRREAGLVIWSLLAFGLAFGVLPRAQLGPIRLIPLAGLTLLALLAVIGLTSTPSDERTFAELSRVVLFTGVLAIPLLALNRFTWRAAAGGLAAAAVGVTALAVATRLAPGTLEAADVATLFGRHRLTYPLDYWNAVGAWGSMTAALALGWSAHSKIPWLRAVMLASVPIAVLCVYLTFSRGGAIGLAVGVITVIALSRNRWTAVVHAAAAAAAGALAILVARGQPEIANATGGAGGSTVAIALVAAMAICAGVAFGTLAVGLDRMRLQPRIARRLAPVAIVAALAVLVVGGAGFIADTWDEFRNERAPARFEDPESRLTTAAGTRSDTWDEALDAFSSEPLTGIGPGTFELYWSQHAPVAEFLRDAHSLYLEVLAEFGLLGLVAVLIALVGGVAIATLTRSRLDRSADLAAAVAMIAAAVVFVVQAGLDWMWEETAVSAFGLAAIGVVLVADAGRIRRRTVPKALRIAAVAFAVLAAATQVPGLISTARVRESNDALLAGRTSQALELANEAIEAEPWASTAYMQRAAVRAADGDMGAAAGDVREAIDRDRLYWRPWFALVQLELARGDRSAAARGFDQLERLSLRSAVPYATLAEFARDPSIKASTREGCLALSIGACANVDTAAVLSRCLEPPGPAVDAIERFRGGPIGPAEAVRGALGREPIYYVASVVDGEIAIWALTLESYREGIGGTIPLTDAARSLFDPEALAAPEEFGLSEGDRGARRARTCVADAAAADA